MSNYFSLLGAFFLKASQGFFEFLIPSFSFLVILLSKSQTPKLASLMWIVEVVGLQRTVVPMGGVWVGNQRMQVQTRFKEVICGCFIFYFSIFGTTVFMHFTFVWALLWCSFHLIYSWSFCRWCLLHYRACCARIFSTSMQMCLSLLTRHHRAWRISNGF